MKTMWGIVGSSQNVSPYICWNVHRPSHLTLNHLCYLYRIQMLVVFQPTVWSLVTSGYEPNRSGACHRSLGGLNSVTFYLKKESLSKKSFSSLCSIHLLQNYIPSTNLRGFGGGKRVGTRCHINWLMLLLNKRLLLAEHFCSMSHSHPNVEHPFHLFEAITHHISWTVGQNTTVYSANEEVWGQYWVCLMIGSTSSTVIKNSEHCCKYNTSHSSGWSQHLNFLTAFMVASSLTVVVNVLKPLHSMQATLNWTKLL